MQISAVNSNPSFQRAIQVQFNYSDHFPKKDEVGAIIKAQRTMADAVLVHVNHSDEAKRVAQFLKTSRLELSQGTSACFRTIGGKTYLCTGKEAMGQMTDEEIYQNSESNPFSKNKAYGKIEADLFYDGSIARLTCTVSENIKSKYGALPPLEYCSKETMRIN